MGPLAKSVIGKNAKSVIGKNAMELDEEYVDILIILQNYTTV
jgi:hypothetical protein